jgi:hypothetical protein
MIMMILLFVFFLDIGVAFDGIFGSWFFLGY